MAIGDMCCNELLAKLTTKEFWLKPTTKEFWLKPPEPGIGSFFWIMYIFGFLTYLGSFAVNVRSLVSYAADTEWWLFSILLVAIILPQVPINLFSFWWYRTDSEQHWVSWKRTIAHCLLLALPLRMVKMGLQAKKTGTGETGAYHRFYLAQADLSFLRLVCVYAGSGLQLVVRIYIMLMHRNTNEGDPWRTVFAVLTAVSLALSTISLCRHCRSHRYDKEELSYASIILQVLYRICFLASRVVALACLFVLGITPALVTCLIILVCLFSWFRFMKTDFTENGRQERFYHLVMAYLHIFGVFNVKDTPARYRYAFYYSLSFVCEVFIIVTFMRVIDGLYWLSLFPCVFLVGLVCHGMEHQYFHPGGSKYIRRELSEWELHCDACAEDRQAASETYACAA